MFLAQLQHGFLPFELRTYATRRFSIENGFEAGYTPAKGKFQRD
jgi:hypothetical protein